MRQQSPVGAAGRAASRAAAGLSAPVTSTVRISYRRLARGTNSADTAPPSSTVTASTPLSPVSSKPRPSGQPG